MISNPLKEKLARGETAYGALVGWPGADMPEFLGFLGFDWIFIDAEHGTIGRESCEAMVRACNVAGVTPIVRVPANDRAMILGYLETGAMGIIVPHVNTAEDARAAVAAVRYLRPGKRGAGSTSRAAHYGLTQPASDYFRQANDAILLMIVIEEAEGVANLEEILAVAGIDAVAVGPGDMALSMGYPGQSNEPAVRRLVEEAEARLARATQAMVTVVGDAEEARAAVNRGADMIIISAARLLSSAAHTFLESAR